MRRRLPGGMVGMPADAMHQLAALILAQPEDVVAQQAVVRNHGNVMAAIGELEGIIRRRGASAEDLRVMALALPKLTARLYPSGTVG